jgi:hypothetical protein
MAGMNSTTANNILKLYLQATAIANIADNASSSPITNTYASAHTADPANGTQASSETSYTSYSRQALARSSGGWTVTSNVANPVANIVFPISTGGTPTLTYMGVGKTSGTGATDLWFSGTITPNIVVSTAVTQIIANTSTITLT